jgi:Protein of unknown function (DUF3667)
LSDPISGLLAEGVAAVAVAGAADDQLRPAGKAEAGHCHNCQTPLSGPFCQACGQKAGHLHKPIWELTHDFVHSVLHWDGRIWVTLRAMMFTPAKHANDWINGRQMRYVPPIRLFVFVSLMIIALLSFTDVVLWQLKKKTYTPAEIAKAYDSQEGALLCLLGSVDASAKPDSDSCESMESFSPEYEGRFLSLASRNMGLKEDLIDTQNVTIKGGADPGKALGVIAHFNDMMKKPKEFNDAVSSSLSKYLLLAVPIHALLLKIFYIRRKRYLMEHVIFSLQSHTVLFLMLLVVLLLSWISRGSLSGDILMGGLFIAYSVHLFVAMKRFYGQGAIRTSLKYMTIGGLYFIIMVTIGSLLLARSMGGFDEGRISISADS